MLFILINETRSDLTGEDYALLGEKMKDFYTNIPPGIKLVGDYSTVDKKKNFSIIEADSIEEVDALKAPFAKYVNIEVYQVKPSGYLTD